MSAYLFDTETTGIDEPVIIEAAWLKLDTPFNPQVLDRFEQRYNPGKPIQLGALATHHILDEELAYCPPASEFKLPDDCQYLIGHNIDFDWKAIGEPPVKRICTLALCRRFFPEADSHTQSAMMYLLERGTARERLRNAHSAMADIVNCLLILDRVLAKAGTVTETVSWEFIWALSEAARIPTKMTFGKHKGMQIDHAVQLQAVAAWTGRPRPVSVQGSAWGCAMKSSLPDICSALIVAHDRVRALNVAVSHAEGILYDIYQKLIIEHGKITDERGNVIRDGVDSIFCGDRLIRINHAFDPPFVSVEKARMVVIGNALRLGHDGGLR